MEETGQGSVSDTVGNPAVPPAGKQSLQLTVACLWIGAPPCCWGDFYAELGGHCPVLFACTRVTDLHQPQAPKEKEIKTLHVCIDILISVRTCSVP